LPRTIQREKEQTNAREERSKGKVSKRGEGGKMIRTGSTLELESRKKLKGIE